MLRKDLQNSLLAAVENAGIKVQLDWRLSASEGG